MMLMIIFEQFFYFTFVQLAVEITSSLNGHCDICSAVTSTQEYTLMTLLFIFSFFCKDLYKNYYFIVFLHKDFVESHTLTNFDFINFPLGAANNPALCLVRK